ncbi:Uncharacterised protein [Vibrio cholerae]|nr:Uncharacterised protein [Vibrio cholerae]
MTRSWVDTGISIQTHGVARFNFCPTKLFKVFLYFRGLLC